MKKGSLIAIFYFLYGSLSGQEVKYGICTGCWNPDSLGNHRALVTYNGHDDITKVIIPWRRRDYDPQNKRIIIQDAKTKQKIQNIKASFINREYGEIYFQPVSGKGDYYIYYMPYKNEGRSNYPKGVYLKPDSTASLNWLASIKNKKNILSATVKEIQSIDSLNSFYPMEVIATAAETKQLLKEHPGETYLVFPEDRMHPIKMINDIPQHWIKSGAQNNFTGNSDKGEWFAFQLGIYAVNNMEEIKIQFSDLKSNTGQIISSNHFTCINTDGINYDATEFHKTINLEAGKVQAMWCGIDIPETITAGIYEGKLQITAKGQVSKEIKLKIIVSNHMAVNGGVNEPWKQTRLKWLNSTLAQENTVIAPYTALQVENNSISLLGRKIELNADGLPKQIQTFFTPEMTSYTDVPKDILAEPMHFHFHITGQTKKVEWKLGGVKFTSIQPGTVKWDALSTSDDLQMDVSASMEFDGFIAYTVKVTALKDVDLKDINFLLPFNPDASKYIMGLGLKGEKRPSSFSWKWDVATKNQDGAWIGDVNAGLQYSLRDEKYVRPLNTNFYLQKPLLLPTSWGNEGKGGINISDENKTILVNNYSGSRHMQRGEVLYFNFTLLITPFHTINTDFQWETRFYHKYNNLDSIKATGATVVNIHHATPINPWINYPFIEWRKMKNYIDEAHSKGLKVKIYYTIRELSDHAYETFPMRSLGHEIYSSGKGGGFSWLQEHLGDDYIAGWFVPEIKDAAILNGGMSRWHNYYVEGMNWLVNNVGIDGIYLDDVAFDRVTMKRIKRVLTQNGHPGIIDFHSANQFDKNDGFNNSAYLYMEHFPYLNRLWFGEYFDYENNSPDFFLTEVSGIPFGLMGEMLQGGGNPWRGMIYGMTNRMPWSDNADPRPIWKVWDDFGMKGSEMIGYWSENCPVKTNNDKVLATVYKKNGAALISVASWADSTVKVSLNINWEKLGINPFKATITAPEVKNFQPALSLNVSNGEVSEFTVEKGKGWMFIIKENK